jgi:uncharacterized membrane protein
MADDGQRNILAATFSTPLGGTRAAGALAGAFPDGVGNTAVLFVTADGEAKFVESKDWGAGRGALLGGAIGILGGPIGIVAGGAIGGLASKLRDSGFKNDELEQLGQSMAPGTSAVVVEISADAVDQAKRVLNAMDARQTVLAKIESEIHDLFDGESEPAIEPDEAAAVGWKKLEA